MVGFDCIYAPYNLGKGAGKSDVSKLTRLFDVLSSLSQLAFIILVTIEKSRFIKVEFTIFKVDKKQ